MTLIRSLYGPYLALMQKTHFLHALDEIPKNLRIFRLYRPYSPDHYMLLIWPLYDPYSSNIRFF